jgi:hypothetical protein
MLHVHAHAACACPRCMSMSMQHVHVHAACPCPCCMSMSAASPCPCCTSMPMTKSLVRVCVCVYVRFRVRVRGGGGVRVHVCVCIYAGMPDCPAFHQSGTGMKKLTMPGPIRYRTKLTQSGIILVQYLTEFMDAGMAMSALVFSMPMPSYDNNMRKNRFKSCLNKLSAIK